MVEFALVIGPFLTLLLGLFEILLIFFFGIMLDQNTQDVARLIRTGNIEQTITKAEFETQVCEHAALLPDCSSRLAVSAQVAGDFESGAFENPYDEDGGFAPDELTFDIGGADDVVVMQVFYEWEVITPLIGKLLSNTQSGEGTLLVATVAMKNEPF